MRPNKDSVYFILSGTRFAANLGAAARVMKNMGFTNLLLVSPQCDVGMEARTRAMKGADVLDRARLFPSLQAAAAEVDLLVGTSSHFGRRKRNWIESRSFCREVLVRHLPNRIGIAFGSEENGLTREEAGLCQWLVEIPTGSDYGVLNLAQAVGILAYELHLEMSCTGSGRALNHAATGHVSGLQREAERLLAALDYPAHVPRSRVMDRLKKLISRAELEVEDVNLFRGLIRRLNQVLESKASEFGEAE